MKFLATCVSWKDSDGKELIPFPSLVELKLRCERISPEAYAIVLEQCRDILSVRKAAGFPMRWVKLYRIGNWDDGEEEGLTEVLTD